MLRQAERPGQRDPFEARGDIDTVAREFAVALLNDITEMVPIRNSMRFSGRNRRPLLCEQAFGESLDPGRLERLVTRSHIDRKLERMLAMLLRLKGLRQGAIAG